MRSYRSIVSRYLGWRKNRKGAAAVELAIISPVLLLLIAGSLEFGQAVMVKNLLEETARAGCRVATMEGATEADVLEVIDAAMEIADIAGYTVTIDPNPPGAAEHLEPITVSVSIPFSGVSWLAAPTFLSDETLTGTCVMPAQSTTPGGTKKIDTKKSDNKKTDTKKSKKTGTKKTDTKKTDTKKTDTKKTGTKK
jgi:hypothetical protein